MRLGVTQYSYPVGAVLPAGANNNNSHQNHQNHQPQHGGSQLAGRGAAGAAGGAGHQQEDQGAAGQGQGQGQGQGNDDAANNDMGEEAPAAGTATPEDLVISPNGVAYVSPQVCVCVCVRVYVGVWVRHVCTAHACVRKAQ